MKWALNREPRERDKFVVAFANLTKAQANHLLQAFLELEKAEVTAAEGRA